MSELAPTPSVVEQIRTTVLAVSGVSELHAGAFGQICTYLPGERVIGIRQNSDETEIHITSIYGFPVLQVAEDVRVAAEAVAKQPVHVIVEDVVVENVDVG